MPIKNQVNPPDVGNEHAPQGVVDFRRFKDRLMAGDVVPSSTLSSDAIALVPRFSDASSMQTVYTTDADADDADQNDLDYTNIMADSGIAQQAAEQPEEYRAIRASKEPAHTIAAYLESLPSKEDVRIIGDFGKLSLKAINVSVTEFGIAFVIKKDAIQFEPNINTSLKIEYKGVEYDVVYAGGFFTFPKIAFTFVSFLRVNP